MRRRRVAQELDHEGENGSKKIEPEIAFPRYSQPLTWHQHKNNSLQLLCAESRIKSQWLCLPAIDEEPEFVIKGQ